MIARMADVEKDRDHLIAGVRDFVSRMDFTAFMPDSDEGFEDSVLTVLSMDFVETYVVEYNGVIVSGIGIAYVPFLWNMKMIQADELFWWAAPDAPKTAALRVLRFAHDNVKKLAEIATFKALTSSPDGVARIYKKMGLRPVETNFMGVL